MTTTGSAIVMDDLGDVVVKHVGIWYGRLVEFYTERFAKKMVLLSNYSIDITNKMDITLS